MTSPIAPLPVVTIVNDLMTIESYLYCANTIKLPLVITQNPQYGTLITNFGKWQYALWSEFWQSLLSSNVVSQSNQISQLFQLKVALEPTVHNVFYGSKESTTPIAVSICAQLGKTIQDGQSLLTQLEAIAKGIQNADRKQVEQIAKQIAILQAQFDEQEEKLTKGALGLGKDLVATIIDVVIAAGTEGDMLKPLKKGVKKIAEDTIGEVKLTRQISDTLNELEAEWVELDEATANLVQITMICNQLKAVTDDSAPAKKALEDLAANWNTVASTTTVGLKEWESGYSAALKEWADQIILVSFKYATQTVTLTPST
ncbi:hypothetical protein [Paraburkholderia aspalathi]|uniref:hypothetical protein n=1 Tax=Paraburkholderia aspalathi TaxID=1324617 RepID=UPI0038BA59A2